MRSSISEEVATRGFRANPAYELVVFERLSPAEQTLFQNLQNDPDFYGILRPCEGTGLGFKSACQETALLFLTLQRPLRLPDYVRSQSSEGWHEAVVELVLDGILQIESDDGFVSGAEAHPLFFDGTPDGLAPNVLARLSNNAIRCAQALPQNEVQILSYYLYSYNRMPLTPAWKRQYPTARAVVERLGIQSGEANQTLLEKYWKATRTSASDEAWLSWQARHRRATGRRTDVTYKLYLSPEPARVFDVFVAVLESSGSLNAFAFKLGKNAYGLLRPDKMVIYFDTLQDLAEGAEELRRVLEGCPAQGVPFSAAITPNGLLSWGIDPPRATQTPLALMGESWRLWITNRLARALLAARESNAETVEPWQFALDRIRLEGIDTVTWAPGKTMWKSPTGEE